MWGAYVRVFLTKVAAADRESPASGPGSDKYTAMYHLFDDEAQDPQQKTRDAALADDGYRECASFAPPRVVAARSALLTGADIVGAPQTTPSINAFGFDLDLAACLDVDIAVLRGTSDNSAQSETLGVPGTTIIHNTVAGGADIPSPGTFIEQVISFSQSAEIARAVQASLAAPKATGCISQATNQFMLRVSKATIAAHAVARLHVPAVPDSTVVIRASLSFLSKASGTKVTLFVDFVFLTHGRWTSQLRIAQSDTPPDPAFENRLIATSDDGLVALGA